MSVTIAPTTAPPAPLSPAEVATAARVLRAEVALPPAARLTGFAPAGPAPASNSAQARDVAADRDAVVIVLDPQLDLVYEAVVAVDDGFVRSFRRYRAGSSSSPSPERIPGQYVGAKKRAGT